MRAKRLRSEMILQVHDELVFRVPTAELQTMAALAAEVMTGAMTEFIKDVPIQVDVHAGRNWAELEPVR
jgi:DNA polymerase-1